MRWRLTAILAGIVVVIAILGCAAWQVSARSSDVVEAAARIHERTQTFSQFKIAIDDLQRVSYAEIRGAGPQLNARMAAAWDEYNRALAATAALPAASQRERAVQAMITAQGEEVRRLFSSARDVVTEVNAQWEIGGSLAALEEVHRLSQPYFNLTETLTREIRFGDVQLRQTTEQARKAQMALFLIGSIGVTSAFALAALALVLILTRLGPGLRKLERGVANVGQGVTGNDKIDIGGRDELATLARVFNAMTDRIALQQQDLRAVSRGLEAAIAKRTEELALAHQQLSQEDLRRRRFIAEISHELRTPITIIRGEADVALRKIGTPGFDYEASFERIHNQSRSLACLVNDLFLLAKAEVGGLHLEVKELDLSRFVRHTISDMEPIASVKQARLVARIADNVWIEGDEERLRQIVAALIDNALRHTQLGVEIVISLRCASDRAIIEICDNGPGVAIDDMEALFNRFVRGTRRNDSSGLGLTIARALAEAHGGICALHANISEGLTAKVELPLGHQKKKSPDGLMERTTHVETAAGG